MHQPHEGKVQRVSQIQLRFMHKYEPAVAVVGFVGAENTDGKTTSAVLRMNDAFTQMPNSGIPLVFENSQV